MVCCNEGGDSGTFAMRVETVVCCNEGGDSGTLQ